MPKKKLSLQLLWIVLAAGTLALSGCGGGGGGSSSSLADGTYRNTVSGNYATEYNYQSMLSSINPLSLNDYGYTGDGVRVAVVDSGIDSSHSEFDGKTILGYDFAGSASGYAADENGHGTHVASIIAGERDGTGMRGVAYDASLYSYKVDNDGDSSLEGLSTDTQIADVFNRHVTDNIQISNNSWGGSSRITSATESSLRSSFPETISALRAAQNNGTLLVFAAGNSGALQPNYFGGMPLKITELADEWLVVTAVDSNLKETAYTDRCGDAWAFCVTAPGGGDSSSTDGILAAEPSGTYTRKSGTSMATPHVAGLAAALMEKFPSLTAAQIATRIKNSASYSGLTTYDGYTESTASVSYMRSVFGHGLVNATAAASQIGSLIYPKNGEIEGGHNIDLNKISMSAGLPKNIQKQIQNTDFAVFDSFDGARFFVSGEKIFETNNQTFHLPSYKKKITSSATYQTENRSNFYDDGITSNQPDISMHFASDESQKIVTNELFWNEKSNLFNTPSIFSKQKSNGIYFNGTILNIDNLSFNMQPFLNYSDSDNNIGGGGISVNAELANKLSLSLGFGAEKQSLDNGFGSSSRTIGNYQNVEFGLQANLSPSNRGFFRFTQGTIDDVSPTVQSFGLQGAELTGWTVGFENKSDYGKLAFGLSKPTELSGGKVSILAPNGRTKAGDIYYKEMAFAINEETAYQTFLSYKYEGDNLDISVNLTNDRYKQDRFGEIRLDISYQF